MDVPKRIKLYFDDTELGVEYALAEDRLSKIAVGDLVSLSGRVVEVNDYYAVVRVVSQGAVRTWSFPHDVLGVVGRGN